MEVMHHVKASIANDATTQEPTPAQADTVEQRRARRMNALKKAAGLWTNREDIPADGLEYQRELRTEWR